MNQNISKDEVKNIDWQVGFWFPEGYKGKYIKIKGTSTPGGHTFKEVWYNEKLRGFKWYSLMFDKNPELIKEIKEAIHTQYPITKKWEEEFIEQKKLLDAIEKMKKEKENNKPESIKPIG